MVVRMVVVVVGRGEKGLVRMAAVVVGRGEKGGRGGENTRCVRRVW